MNTFVKNIIVLSTFAVLSITNAEVDCDKKRPQVHPEECCKLPNLISEKVQAACEEYSKPQTTDVANTGHGSNQLCFPSCVVNTTGILINGELNQQNLNQYLKEALEDEELIKILDRSFQLCYDDVNKLKETVKKMNLKTEKDSLNMDCPLHDALLIGCAIIRTLNQCPATIWTNTDECNNERQFWNKCLQQSMNPSEKN